MLWICYAAAFMVSFSIAGAFLALPLHAIARFDAQNFQLGLLSASAAAIYIGMSFFSGRISEHFRIRTQLMLATLVLGVGFFALELAPFYWLLVVLQVINGLGMGFYWAPLEATVSRLSAPGRVRANMGWYNLAWSLGMMTGYFAFRYFRPIEIAFPVSGGLVLATGIMMAFLRAPSAQKVVVREHTDGASGRLDARRRFFLVTSWLGVLTAYMGVGAARHLFPKLATEVHLSNNALSTVYASGLLAQTVMMAAMGAFGAWHYKVKTVLLGGLGLGGAALLIGVGSGWPVFGAGHVLLGVAMSVVYSSSLYYSMEDSAHAHRNTSMHEAMIGVGLTSPVFIGYVADYFQSTRLTYFIVCGFALLFTAFYVGWAALRKDQLSAEETETPIAEGSDAEVSGKEADEAVQRTVEPPRL